MADILIVSNPPFFKTGYGVQAYQLAQQLLKNGHDTAIQAIDGLQEVALEWGGVKVLPGSFKRGAFGADLMAYYAREYEADAVITLLDAFVYASNAQVFGQVPCPVGMWAPVDHLPLGKNTAYVLQQPNVVPVAMSRFGQEVMKATGLEPLYAPHAVDTSEFRPPTPEQRTVARELLGVSESTFVIGINAANASVYRKGWFEQFMAFANFARRHPDSLLVCNCIPQMGSSNGMTTGLNLVALTEMLGIQGKVRFPPPESVITGMPSQSDLIIQFYWALDALSNCSWGEGFGLTPLEAQGCGVPVVVTEFSAMTEVAAPGPHGGILVPSSPIQTVEHGAAIWGRPNMASIEQGYETLLSERESGQITARQEAAREHALTYDRDVVFARYWVPVIETLTARCKPGCILMFGHKRPADCQVSSVPLCPVCRVSEARGKHNHQPTDTRR